MKSIIIIRCGALGDLVYSTSVIDALKLQYGDDIIIDFVCTPSSSSLFKDDTRINKVFHLKHKKPPIWLSPQKYHIIKYSKEKPYDLLINFESGKQFKSLIDNIIAGKKIDIFNKNNYQQEKRNRAEVIKFFLTQVISYDSLQNSYPSVAVSSLVKLKKDFALSNNYIVIAPSNSHIKKSGINYRAWENQKWKELLEKLSKKIQIILVGAKGEEFFFEDFRPLNKNTIDLVGSLSITQLSTIVSGAKAVVCTDSAIGHISAAVNTPVFILMGPNDPITDSPYKTRYNQVYIISANLQCSPCYKTEVMKNCIDNICMKKITPQQVYGKILQAKII